MTELLGASALAIFGFCYIVGHSTISLPVRTRLAQNRVGNFFVQLLECPACASFHAGWVTYLCSDFYWIGPKSFYGAVIAGCFFAATSFILGRATGIISAPQHYFSHPFSPTVEERHITEVTSETEK